MPVTSEDKILDFFNQWLDINLEPQITETEEEIAIDIQVEPHLSGLLIGRRGEVITAAQLLLTLIHEKHAGIRKPIRLNINDYRQQRENSLENLSQRAANKALELNQPISIPDLSSYERRIIHLNLQNNPDVVTSSEGEPPNRILIVSPTKL